MGSLFIMIASSLAVVLVGDFIYSQLSSSDSIIKTITEALPGIYNFFVSLREFFSGIIEIFPSPFDSLIGVFILILFGIFLWKFVKGGG